MTARETAEIRDSWPELRAFATAMRPDWEPDEIRDALLACQAASVPYKDAAKEAWRLIWDAEGQPFELRNLARNMRPLHSATALTREEREELRAKAVAACEAATERQQAEPRARDSA